MQRVDLEEWIEQATNQLDEWARGHLPLLHSAKPLEVRLAVDKAIDEIAGYHTPSGSHRVLELAYACNAAQLGLADTPLKGYNSTAVGIMAHSLFELLRLRLETHYSRRIEPFLSIRYVLDPGTYALLAQNDFGWKVIHWSETSVDAVVSQLLRQVLARYEDDSAQSYRIVLIWEPEPQLLAEIKCHARQGEYNPDAEYHVWSDNWNHYIGDSNSFELAKAFVAYEIKRALRSLVQTVELGLSEQASVGVVDESVRPVETVWEISIRIGEPKNEEY